MKLLTFKGHGEVTVRVGGVTEGNKIIDLTSAYTAYLYEKEEPNPAQLAHASLPMDMLKFIEGGQTSLRAAEKAIAYARDKTSLRGLSGEKLIFSEDEIDFLPPILHPGKIICAARNYEEHNLETKDAAAKMPIGFLKASSTLVGHRGQILYTKFTPALDYEIELAVVIGRKGKYINRDEAIDYVFGYTIFNDVSERALNLLEVKEGFLLGGKNMDTLGPIGPWIITQDEIEAPHDMNMTLRVNGEIRQQSNTKNMIYDISDQIAYWSSRMTLYPGDIFSTGTPSGVAFTRKPRPEPYYLKPGDLVEAEIEGLGTLVNKVVEEQ